MRNFDYVKPIRCFRIKVGGKEHSSLKTLTEECCDFEGLCQLWEAGTLPRWAKNFRKVIPEWERTRDERERCVILAGTFFGVPVNSPRFETFLWNHFDPISCMALAIEKKTTFWKSGYAKERKDEIASFWWNAATDLPDDKRWDRRFEKLTGYETYLFNNFDENSPLVLAFNHEDWEQFFGKSKKALLLKFWWENKNNWRDDFYKYTDSLEDDPNFEKGWRFRKFLWDNFDKDSCLVLAAKFGREFWEYQRPMDNIDEINQFLRDKSWRSEFEKYVGVMPQKGFKFTDLTEEFNNYARTEDADLIVSYLIGENVSVVKSIRALLNFFEAQYNNGRGKISLAEYIALCCLVRDDANSYYYDDEENDLLTYVDTLKNHRDSETGELAGKYSYLPISSYWRLPIDWDSKRIISIMLLGEKTNKVKFSTQS